MKMRSKMHKYAKGESNPTGNRAVSKITRDEATEWVKKIDEQGTDFGGVEKVLRDLIASVRSGETTMEVVEEVLKRRMLRRSIEKIMRQGV